MDYREELKLAMHGFGYIGKKHVLALKTCSVIPELNPNVTWEHCVVPNLNSMSAQSAQQTFKNVSDDISSIHDFSVDAIDIVSPNDVHAPVAFQSMRDKLPIYCEKPLSNQIEVSRQLTQEASQLNLLNQVALVYRFHPAVEEAYYLLRSGQLGQIFTFRAVLLHGGYLDPEREMSWRLRENQAGAGAVLDLGVHLIDLVQFLLSPIVEVHASLQTFVRTRGHASDTVNVDDWAHLRVYLQEGIEGTIEVSRVHLGLEANYMQIVCEKGSIEMPLDRMQSAKISYLHTPQSFSYSSPLNTFRIPIKWSNDFMLHCHATSLLTFIHRVRGGSIDYPLPNFLDALNAEEVVEASKVSSDTGQLQRVNKSEGVGF